jgi:hypothetical protein
MSAELLRDLARAKVAFQLRAIETVIRGGPVRCSDCCAVHPQHLASCDTRRMAETGNTVRSTGGAVLSESEADAQTPSNNIYSGHDLR